MKEANDVACNIQGNAKIQEAERCKVDEKITLAQLEHGFFINAMSMFISDEIYAHNGCQLASDNHFSSLKKCAFSKARKIARMIEHYLQRYERKNTKSKKFQPKTLTFLSGLRVAQSHTFYCRRNHSLKNELPHLREIVAKMEALPKCTKH